MEKNIPCIGQHKPPGPFCGGPFAEAVHPKMGKVMAPVCNCPRPVHLGDLKLFEKSLEKDSPLLSSVLKEFIEFLEDRAKSERGV